MLSIKRFSALQSTITFFYTPCIYTPQVYFTKLLVETPNKFIVAMLLIRKHESSSVSSSIIWAYMLFSKNYTIDLTHNDVIW